MRFVSRSIATLAVAALAACGHKDDHSNTVVISPPKDAIARPLGEGDVRIVAPDNGVDLALIGDTISSGLSEAALAKARSETDTGAVKGSGFAASLEKTIKSSVQSAIGTRVGFPLSQVKDARYEGNRIVFDWNGPPSTIFDHSSVNHKPLLESFTPADAQRFVDAVNARKRSATAQ
jgi:hypothetical protein